MGIALVLGDGAGAGYGSRGIDDGFRGAVERSRTDR